MSIVLDSNLLIAIAVDDPRAPAVAGRLRFWAAAGEELHAPELFRCEVANGLTRSVVASVIREEQIEEAWQLVAAVPITFHPLHDVPE